jgi:heme A synthase
MTTARVIVAGTTSKLACPHWPTCRVMVKWRNDDGKASRDRELKAYNWFNRQTIEHKH